MASLSEQQRQWLFNRVHRESNIFPYEVDQVEAHGIGTLVGDPVECKSIKRVLNVGRDWGRPIVVGYVKSNVGHLQLAAGILSLIKVAYALKHNLIPPTISTLTLNPRIDMKALNSKIVTQLQQFPASTYEGKQ
ncbi:MAG: putative polyketide synthase [Streblomastix strix]|uniref:Putative polyketide synthase n=1 Tax=Streblomastix strix TaxID=222440 RepID=A0A5J4V3E1_9EUKA|nr:MAG: putative polyketide synthase [Streblomastix strix]